MSSTVSWLPIESNPTVMNQYLKKLGVSLDKYHVVDVYGIDEALLAMIPQPVLAFMLLYPIEGDDPTIKSQDESHKNSENLYFVKQKVSNACGTVALIHTVANNEDIELNDDGPLKNFLDKTKGGNPDDRATALEKDKGIAECHSEAAEEGQTAPPKADEVVKLHFISLVHKDGALYELDGRKENPIYRGPTKPETFVKDAAKVCKDYMDAMPGKLNFNITALAKVEE